MNKKVPNLGCMNGHAIGRILKETVRRAMYAIRTERLKVEVSQKPSYGGGGQMDVFTNADLSAQQIYLKAFDECFPGYGVIAEERSLRIEPSKKHAGLYFTVDPLDGTKAFIRGQSHGVGTMVALVYSGKVISSYVGDVNTKEVYGYRPGSESVYRITDLDLYSQLKPGKQLPIGKTYALLRDPAHKYSEATQRLLPRFNQYEVTGSSIGIWMARLWKGEVAAAFIPPTYETPWDSTPVIGISLRLGFTFLRPGRSGRWVPYKPIISRDMYQRSHDTLVIAPGYLSDIAH